MNASIVIPARIGSTRLPNKILADINGKPMLWHVWKTANQVPGILGAYVACDDEGVKSLVESWGGKAILTDPACISGTHRIASIIDQIQGNYILGLQADEPFVTLNILQSILTRAAQTSPDILTPIYPIQEEGDLSNPNVVKVVTSHNEQALYFSRSPIPYMRNHPEGQWLKHHTYYGHLGIYCYQRKVLEDFKNLAAGTLDQVESLEQLRFLQADYTIQTILTSNALRSVDVMEDLLYARAHLTQS